METGKPLDNLSKQVSCIRQLEMQASFQKMSISLLNSYFAAIKTHWDADRGSVKRVIDPVCWSVGIIGQCFHHETMLTWPCINWISKWLEGIRGFIPYDIKPLTEQCNFSRPVSVISFDQERVKILFSQIFIAIVANRLSVDLKKTQFS